MKFAAAAIAWLAATALLGSWGIGAGALMVLNALVILVMLVAIGRTTVVGEAHAFLSPGLPAYTLAAPGAAAEWVSGFGVIGVVMAIASLGFEGFAVIGGLLAGYVISAALIQPALIASGARSLPDLIGRRAGPKASAFMTWVVYALCVLLLAVQFALAVGFADQAFAAPAIVVVVLLALLVLVSGSPGGLKTLVPAQAALFGVLCLGALAPALWVSVQAVGIPVPHIAHGALLHEIAVMEAGLSAGDGFSRIEAGRAVLIGLTVMLGTAALPHTHGRWFAEPDTQFAGRIAKRVVFLMLLVVCALPVIAVAARAADLLPAFADRSTAPDLMRSVSQVIQALAPPAWLLAAAGAAVLAAVVAASGSAALTAATVFDQHVERETAGGLLSRFRWSLFLGVLIAAVLAMAVGIDSVDGFLWLGSLASATLLVPLMLVLWWSGVTPAGIIGSVIAGALATLVLFFLMPVTLGLLASGLSLSTAVIVSIITEPYRATGTSLAPLVDLRSLSRNTP